MAEIVCPTCEAPTAADDDVCRSCGTELEPPPSPAAETRRIVTVLFSDVTGSTVMGEQLDPESLRRVMSRYFTAMEVVLKRHGATVEKYIGDAVMAVFGMPRAHEDDALRAVRAAVEMRDSLGALNTELRERWGVTIVTHTGVNTGEVLAGEASRRQSLVVGDAVNVAARLEQSAAPGVILIGEATLRLVRDAVVVEPVEPLELKGKSGPVAAFELVGVLPTVSGWSRRLDSPLVGRQSELAQLNDAYTRTVADCTSNVVTVMGGAGVGKSRLVAEFLEAVSGQARTAVGRCLPYGEGITFRPISQAIRGLVGITEGDQPSAARERLEHVLADAPDAAMIGERIATLLDIADTPVNIQEVFWAVRRLVQQSTLDRPVVVVIDDIQWGDPTMLDLLEYLADWLGSTRALLVYLARSELLDVRPGWLSGRQNASLLRLDPLPFDAIDQLIRNLLDGDELAAESCVRIATVAEGNPLFVEETLRMLIDDQRLRFVDGRWSVDDHVAVAAIPPTIHALIAARLDRLEAHERAVLERASVVGRDFWWGAVTELTPPDLRPSVGASLQSLTRKELIRRGSSDLPGEDAFEFTHVLVEDTTYAGIPKELRGDLHNRLAVWLERQDPWWRERHEETIAYHYERVHATWGELGYPRERIEPAGRRAARLLASSGRRALSRGDMPAAVSLLSRAAVLLPDSEPTRFDILPRLAFALMETGDFARLMGVVAEMEEGAASSGEPRLVAHATTLALYVRLFTNPESWADEAEREAREAIATFEQIADAHGLAKCWSLLGLVNVWKGQFGAAEHAWEQAAAHAAEADEWREELDALSWVLLAMWAGPTPVDEGLLRSQQVLDRAGTDHKGRASALFMRATFEAAQGRSDLARELISQARALLEEVALTVWTAGPLTQMAGFVELGAGEPQRAERELRWGYDTLGAVGEMAWLPTLAALLAQALHAQGRDDEAEQFADRSKELAGAEDVVSQILWRRVLAGVWARTDPETAEVLIREAVGLAEATDSLLLQGEAYLGLTEVLELLGRPRQARQAAHVAMERFERKGDVQAGHRGHRLLGEPTA